MEDSFRNGGSISGTNQSGMQGSDIGGSRMYEQSNREIIRRAYREEDMTGSSKRFQRDGK